MNTTDLIAITSAIISLIAVGISYYSFRKTLHASSRPILIFSMAFNFQWRLDNVGTGPAINLSVGENDPSRNFLSITKCYPLSAGGYLDLPWVKPAYGLAAVYTGIHGDTYTTIYSGSRNEIFDQNKFPGWAITHEQWLQVLIIEGRSESNLTEDDLKGKTSAQLDIMRNEIYARKGYIFKRPDLAKYFSKQSWYKPITTDHNKVYNQFSAGEKYEVHLILNYQDKKGLRTKGPITFLNERDHKQFSEGDKK